MRYLLDTHALLWYTLADPQLSAVAEAVILDRINEIHVSPASYWEIAIKVSIGKFLLNQPFATFVDACINRYGFITLPIEPRHAAALITMPFHHRDPFDRMLVAQATIESMSIISIDGVLDSYSIKRVW